MLGMTVGSYRITGQIAVGGMGTVFRAEHTLIGRIAAIKVLHPEMTTSREIVTRFFNEAKATSTIKHPGIVEVFDFGYMPSGHAYLVMEFLEGETLSQRMRTRGLMSEGEAAMIMRGVCTALSAAHAKGVVHRDLKPDNIFIVPDPDAATGERTKILDFGIAKLTDVGEGNQHTKLGAVMGTPTYMSPEQCRGTGEVDHRADLYSIGCMLYEMLVGRPPFAQTGAGELLGAHLFVDPEPPSRHGPVSPELEGLIMMLLDKKPERRIQTATELAQHLAILAQSSGYAVGATDPRLSMQHIQRPGSQHTPMHLTPRPPSQMTPAHLTPGVAHYTPMHQAPTTIAPPDKPTTLSGTASQQLPVPTATLGKKSRTGAIVAGAFVLAVAGGIAFFVGTSGKDKAISAGAPAETKPVEMTPTETKPIETKPVETKPVEPPPEVKPVEPPPVEDKPADATTKPKVDKPKVDKPKVDKPKGDKKPDKKPDKPEKGELLETDI